MCQCGATEGEEMCVREREQWETDGSDGGRGET